MKKIIIVFVFLLSICLSPVYSVSEVINNNQSAKIQQKISEIGFKILNSNNIDKRMVFYYNISKTINADTSYFDRRITMYRGLYNMLTSDDEIAAVLAHEISHGKDSYKGIMRGAFSGISYIFAPKKYEYKADKLAIDYMVNANYNPVAFIIVMNKAFPQRRFDWCNTHPLTTRRQMQVYEYIYKKYPEYLVDNKYKDNIYYQNFLLTSKENRQKFQNKIENNLNKPVRYL